jgi:hypothetical protein
MAAQVVEIPEGGKALVFTPEALKVMSDMGDRVAVIRSHFGEYSEEFSNIAASYAGSVSNMIRLGGRVYADGELSLIVGNDFLTYGVVFHNRNYRDLDFPHNLMGEWSVHS